MEKSSFFCFLYLLRGWEGPLGKISTCVYQPIYTFCFVFFHAHVDDKGWDNRQYLWMENMRKMLTLWWIGGTRPIFVGKVKAAVFSHINVFLLSMFMVLSVFEYLSRLWRLQSNYNTHEGNLLHCCWRQERSPGNTPPTQQQPVVVSVVRWINEEFPFSPSLGNSCTCIGSAKKKLGRRYWQWQIINIFRALFISPFSKYSGV